MKNSFLLMIVVLLAGCGTITSEIIPAGKDTYLISGHGYAKKAPEAIMVLYKEANDYCKKIGKLFVPISTESQNFDLYSSSVNMHFRCLLAGDPELDRPVMKRAPDTIIEMKP